MAITLLINGVDKTNTVDWESIRKNENASKKSDTLEFLVKNYGTKTFQPAINDVVRLSNGATKVFEGLVVEVQEEIDGLAKYLSVTCKDYTHTLDRQLVSKTYTNQTAEDIVDDLISTFTTGFTSSNAVAPVTIEYIAFNYLTVSQCLEKLTKMLNGFAWYVDYDKDVHFFATALNPAPFNLTDTSENYIFGTLDIKQDTHQLRNDIFIRGGNIISSSSRIEYFNGDGTRLIFALGSKFNVEPTVKIGGVAKTVGVENLDVAGSHDCYWDFNQKTIRFEVAPTSGTNNVTVEGTYFYPLILRKQNNASIATYGVFQHLIIDKTIVSAEAASQRVDVEFAQYSDPTYSGSFITLNDGLRAGQQITITSSIRNLNQTYTIQSIETTLNTPTTFKYRVRVESYVSIGIDDVLKKLLVTDQTEQLEISEGENIQRYSSFSESIVISDTLYAPVKTSPPYLYGSTTGNVGIWNRSTWS